MNHSVKKTSIDKESNRLDMTKNGYNWQEANANALFGSK